MLSELNRMATITSDLLLLAKPQVADFDFKDMRELIDNVVTLVQPQAIMQTIEIIYKHENVGDIYCVRNQIKQVFINILKNGIESMTEGGFIKVNLLGRDEDYILLEVIDKACGIPY